MNRPRVQAHTLVPMVERGSVWYTWLQKIGSGIKSVELKGTLKQVWCNDKGWTIVVQTTKKSLMETLQCDAEVLDRYPLFMTFIPWGEVSDNDDEVVLKVKNNQPSDVIKEAFFEGIKQGDGWALESNIKVHVDVTTFCNFPEAGQIGVSIKMVTPVKIVLPELDASIFDDDFAFN